MADDRLEQRAGDDATRHAGSVHARKLRYVVAGISHVHGSYAQRHQPTLRNLRQRRYGGDCRAHTDTERDFAHLVSAESPASQSEVVAPQQQQLRADRASRIAQLFRQQPAAVPREFLREEQTLGSEAASGRTSRLHPAGGRETAWSAGGLAADSPETARRDFSRDRAIQRCGSGAASAAGATWCGGWCPTAR